MPESEELRLQRLNQSTIDDVVKYYDHNSMFYKMALEIQQRREKEGGELLYMALAKRLITRIIESVPEEKSVDVELLLVKIINERNERRSADTKQVTDEQREELKKILYGYDCEYIPQLEEAVNRICQWLKQLQEQQ